MPQKRSAIMIDGDKLAIRPGEEIGLRIKGTSEWIYPTKISRSSEKDKGGRIVIEFGEYVTLELSYGGRCDTIMDVADERIKTQGKEFFSDGERKGTLRILLDGDVVYRPDGGKNWLVAKNVRRDWKGFSFEVGNRKDKVFVGYSRSKRLRMDALDELAKAQEAEELSKASQVKLTVGGQTGVLQLEAGSVVFVAGDFRDTPSFVWRSEGHFRVTVGEKTGCLEFGDLNQIWLDQLDNLAKSYEEIERREKARQEFDRELIAQAKLEVDLLNLISGFDGFEGDVGYDEPKPSRRQPSKPRNNRDGTRREFKSTKDRILNDYERQARHAAEVSKRRREAVS